MRCVFWNRFADHLKAQRGRKQPRPGIGHRAGFRIRDSNTTSNWNHTKGFRGHEAAPFAPGRHAHGTAEARGLARSSSSAPPGPARLVWPPPATRPLSCHLSVSSLRNSDSRSRALGCGLRECPLGPGSVCLTGGGGQHPRLPRRLWAASAALLSKRTQTPEPRCIGLHAAGRTVRAGRSGHDGRFQRQRRCPAPRPHPGSRRG